MEFLHNWQQGERYRLLLDLVQDGILVHDGEWIVLANASAVQLAGATSRSQVVGLPIDTILSPPYLKTVERQLLDFVSAETIAPPLRDTLRRLDGSELAVEVQTVAFMDGPRFSAHVVIRDITDRLATEHRARETDEQTQALRRRDPMTPLTGSVAHEVNNAAAS